MSRRLGQGTMGALVLLALLVALVCMPAKALASTTAVIVAKVRVFQTYDVSVSGLQNTFEYLIEPSEEGAPMPVDAEGVPYTSFTLRRNDERWLEFPVEVSVDRSATSYVYHYTMRPKQRTLSDGLYYVDTLSTSLKAGVNEYPLEIHVQPSSVDAAVSIVVPTVHAEEFDGPKITDPGWRIGYKEPATDPEEQPSDEGGSSTKTPSTGSSASTVRTTLAATGDSSAMGAVLVGVVGACALLAGVLCRRAGGDHA